MSESACRLSFEVKAMSAYFVDNCGGFPGTPGLSYRLSMDLNDKAPKGYYEAWGSVVLGAQEADGWLRVAPKRYLPMSLQGKKVVLTPREAAMTEVNFVQHNGFISESGNILKDCMTLADAKRKAATLPDCRGFCFHGPMTEESTEVVFKNKWDNAVGGDKWTSFRLEECMRINISSLSDAYTMLCTPEQSIVSMKNQLAEMSGFPVPEQILTFPSGEPVGPGGTVDRLFRAADIPVSLIVVRKVPSPPKTPPRSPSPCRHDSPGERRRGMYGFRH